MLNDDWVIVYLYENICYGVNKEIYFNWNIIRFVYVFVIFIL